jgi:hypothetical protein
VHRMKGGDGRRHKHQQFWPVSSQYIIRHGHGSGRQQCLEYKPHVRSESTHALISRISAADNIIDTTYL